MLLYVNDLMDLLDAYNENREVHFQLDIFDVLDEIEDADDESEIKRMMKEIKNRIWTDNINVPTVWHIDVTNKKRLHKKPLDF